MGQLVEIVSIDLNRQWILLENCMWNFLHVELKDPLGRKFEQLALFCDEPKCYFEARRSWDTSTPPTVSPKLKGGTKSSGFLERCGALPSMEL